jgi:hypothetical protein
LSLLGFLEFPFADVERALTWVLGRLDLNAFLLYAAAVLGRLDLNAFLLYAVVVLWAVPAVKSIVQQLLEAVSSTRFPRFLNI